jgi:hypothetical protein
MGLKSSASPYSDPFFPCIARRSCRPDDILWLTSGDYANDEKYASFSTTPVVGKHDKANLAFWLPSQC